MWQRAGKGNANYDVIHIGSEKKHDKRTDNKVCENGRE